jgi:3-deoxy-D-manno-octulosonate 8-phosphate phosphatase (KDO 8-P phosphatase)
VCFGQGLAPANAHPWVRERAHWRTRHEGGDGAAREVCDMILAAQEKAEQILKDFSSAAVEETAAA